MNSSDKKINDAIERTMKNILDQAFDEMIHNFSLNLSKNHIIDLIRSSLYRFCSESTLQRFSKCNKISIG